MKTFGIVLWVFAALNLIVALLAFGQGADSAGMQKLHAVWLLGILGGLLYYFGQKKNKQQDNTTNSIENHIESNTNARGASSIESLDVLSQLKELCNPRNFMEPYDYNKVNKANTFYQKLLSCDPSDSAIVKQLRVEAETELGVKLSTKVLFDELCDICNPSRFSNEDNYNAEKVSTANSLYNRIQLYKNDYSELEQLKKEASILGLYSIHKFKVGETVYHSGYGLALTIEGIRNNETYKYKCSLNGKSYGYAKEDELKHL